jgi:alpha-tubulin suppressor-like RCC1 family protein
MAVLCLSFSNYRRLHQGCRICFRNALTVFIVLICGSLAAAVIYQRPWELAMSVEPKHGPARLSGPLRPVVCTADLRTMALLPDGRLWAAMDYQWQVKHTPDLSEYVNVAIPHSGTFVGGSNWMALVASSSHPGFLALQADGSLWSIFSVKFGKNFWNRWFPAAPEPQRIGSDNDWKSIAAGENYFMAVKKDGSLWRISDHLDFERIDPGSDWSQVFSGRPYALAVKQNGDVWEWEEFQKGPRWVSLRINLSDALDVDASYGQRLALRKDGSLWAWNGRGVPIFGARIPSNWARPESGLRKEKLFRVGKDADWAQVAGEDGKLFGLKKDGRLIFNSSELFSTALRWPSSYSDWRAIEAPWGNLIALSADGTMCQWQSSSFYDSSELRLGPTRRPLWSLNIFATSKN